MKDWFVKIPIWVFEGDLTAHEKLVFSILLLFADAQGHCYPSLSRIGTCADLGKTAVCAVLNSLEAKGWITRKRRTNEENNAKISTLYTLTKTPPTPPHVRDTTPACSPDDPPLSATEPPLVRHTPTEQIQ